MMMMAMAMTMTLTLMLREEWILEHATFLHHICHVHVKVIGFGFSYDLRFDSI